MDSHDHVVKLPVAWIFCASGTFTDMSHLGWSSSEVEKNTGQPTNRRNPVVQQPTSILGGPGVKGLWPVVLRQKCQMIRRACRLFGLVSQEKGDR